METYIPRTFPCAVIAAHGFPSFTADTLLNILSVNGAAYDAGLKPGISLPRFLDENEMPLHRKHLLFARESRLQPMVDSLNDALYTLHGIRGFTLLHLHYTVQKNGILCRGILFPSRREYLRTSEDIRAACADALISSSAEELRRAAASLSGITAAERTEEITDTLRLTLRTLNESYFLRAERPLIHVPRLLRTILDAAVSAAECIDCDIISSLPSEAQFMAIDPVSFFLMITAALSALSVLADDHAVHIALHPCGAEADLRLSILYPAAAQLGKSPDLHLLVHKAPQLQPALTVVETIAGYCGYNILLSGDAKHGVLTLSLFLPVHREEPEFKSPAQTNALIAAAQRYAAVLLRLLHTEQEE